MIWANFAIVLIVGVAASASGLAAQSILNRQDQVEKFGPDKPAPITMLGGGGDLAFGIFYGNAAGVTGMAEVTQEGLFGSDEDLRFRVEGSRHIQSLGLSLTDDDFMERPIARTISLNGYNVDASADYGRQFGYSALDLSRLSLGRWTAACRSGLVLASRATKSTWSL